MARAKQHLVRAVPPWVPAGYTECSRKAAAHWRLITRKDWSSIVTAAGLSSRAGISRVAGGRVKELIKEQNICETCLAALSRETWEQDAEACTARWLEWSKSTPTPSGTPSPSSPSSSSCTARGNSTSSSVGP